MTGPKTAKGRATRARIVAAASELIAERGLAETSLDDVIERAGVSKSQLYHCFDDRAALLRAVIAYNTEAVLDHVGPLDCWKSIRSWFDELVELQIGCHASGGCPIGSLVGQLAEVDEDARIALADGFDRWEAQLRDGLGSMQAAPVSGHWRSSANLRIGGYGRSCRWNRRWPRLQRLPEAFLPGSPSSSPRCGLAHRKAPLQTLRLGRPHQREEYSPSRLMVRPSQAAPQP